MDVQEVSEALGCLGVIFCVFVFFVFYMFDLLILDTGTDKFFVQDPFTQCSISSDAGRDQRRNTHTSPFKTSPNQIFLHLVFLILYLMKWQNFHI